MKQYKTGSANIIMSDFPDLDVIRVNDAYYMVSTTMHFMPGCVILRSYNLIDWEFVSYVYDELDSTDAQVLHITPYRSYPSGVTANASKRHEYIRWVDSGSCRFIVEDDFESEFTPSRKPEETVFSLSKKENVIYLNTFSKTIAPGIRIGYMVLPEKLLKAYKKQAGFYSCAVPVFEQYVLAEFINSGDFERHINRVRRHNRGR